jgi:type I restriction-modification system DNA methylase subunit
MMGREMMPRTIDDVTLAILSAVACDGNAARITGGQLDRKTYEKINKVLEAAGGKWNKGAKAHLFSGDAADALEPILLTGEYVRAQNFGFFETPPAITDLLMERAQIANHHRVLEPSAGRGAIAFIVAPYAGDIDCIEIQAKNVDLISPQMTPGMTVTLADFLTVTPHRSYDRIIMNPPFAPPRGADVLHVTHALKFLRPGGVLVSVMSAGVTFRQDRAFIAFRELVTAHDGKIESLPDGSFQASGTMVNAVVVTLLACAAASALAAE